MLRPRPGRDCVYGLGCFVQRPTPVCLHVVCTGRGGRAPFVGSISKFLVFLPVMWLPGLCYVIVVCAVKWSIRPSIDDDGIMMMVSCAGVSFWTCTLHAVWKARSISAGPIGFVYGTPKASCIWKYVYTPSKDSSLLGVPKVESKIRLLRKACYNCIWQRGCIHRPGMQFLWGCDCEWLLKEGRLASS